MHRRAAISRITLILGGAISAPTLAALLSGCTAPPAEEFAPRFLSPGQFQLIGRLADLIIPDTDTPGARAAGVDRFIDELLAEYYPRSEALKFYSMLSAFDSAFDLTNRSDEEILESLINLDTAAYADDYTPPVAGSSNELSFHRHLKELVVSGYYTSEIGMKEELRMQPFGPARMDVARSDVERSWSD